MSEIIRYRGRTISSEDLEEIREMIREYPGATRYRLSKLLCQKWNWRQANGALRDMVCRGLMLALHRGGHIQLPPKVCSPVNYISRPKKIRTDFLLNEALIECPLSKLGQLKVCQVRRSGYERVFNGLIEKYHYLGYTQPVGEHLKYIVFWKSRPLACFSWGSAPRHIGSRDRFIGWDAKTRTKHLHFIAYNNRFLVLPWVRVKYLASHLLGRMARQLNGDWQSLYAHPIYYLETFVDRERFAGTCYRAANWQYLGKTTGRGKNDQTNKPNRSLKDVLGYPVCKDFRKFLNAGER